MAHRARLLLGLMACIPLVGATGVAQRSAPPDPPGRAFTPTHSSAGSRLLSPSVIGSYYLTGPSRAPSLELLILWRGSPGWFARRTSQGGSSMSSGSAGGGQTGLSIRQGGLLLTATFDPGNRAVRILDEDIRLDAGANVILVDLVDDPAGPRLLKTLSVVAPDGHANVLHAAFMASPELLDYLRCHAQVSHRAFMDFICAEAIARGMVASEPQLTPIPVDPVQNRAADTAPNLPEPVRRPSDESADPIVSPVVLGTYFARREASGDNVLELLILWRGSPGWHLRGPASAAAAAGTRAGGSDPGSREEA
jgi:hypothetical protein